MRTSSLPRRTLAATGAALALLAPLLGLAAPADAATTHSVCTVGCDYSTIQSAVDAATTGDIIEVRGELVVAGRTIIGKDVSVTGATDANITQTANAVTFLMSGAGSTLSNLTITSNTPKPQAFVQIGANNVTLSGNTIFGPAQPLPMSVWVGNRGVVTQNGITEFQAIDNTFHSMRSGAYLNPNGTGAISGNTLYNTKGDFLIDNANFTFTDNESGDPAQPSEWSFVIFASTAVDRYPDLTALSRANNYMTAWDQRTGEMYVDADRDDANDADDNCDGLANPEQEDADSDGIGDACEADTDGDGVIDDNDAFPNDPTETTDTDGDGTGDNSDNCVSVANSGQQDLDGDDTGDACDSDIDGDGVPNGDDDFPNNPNESNDADGDGIGDSADLDDDNDGLPDSRDTNTKEDCKNGGWAMFTNPTFKNQGQCVSYFAKLK